MNNSISSDQEYYQAQLDRGLMTPKQIIGALCDKHLNECRDLLERHEAAIKRLSTSLAHQLSRKPNKDLPRFLRQKRSISR